MDSFIAETNHDNDTRAAQAGEGAKGDKKTLILKSAFEAFSLYGFKRTSMDDIAKLVDISRPALYQYFANKKTIFRGIIEMFLLEKKELAEQVLQEKLSLSSCIFKLYDIFVLQPCRLMETLPNGDEILGLKNELADDLFVEWEAQNFHYFQRAFMLEKNIGEERAMVLAKMLAFAAYGMKTRQLQADDMEREFKAMVQAVI